MFFRKKMDVKDYCAARMEAICSTERERVWSQFRELSKDAALSGIESRYYFDHIRAIMIELLLIAIAKKCGGNVSEAANIFVLTYLKSHNAEHLFYMVGDYSQVFGSSPR